MNNQLIHQIDNKVLTTGKSIFTFYSGIPSPTLLLRADKGITKDANDKVSQWDDQSSNDFHATQETAANQPLLVENELNEKPVIRFDGNQDLEAIYNEEYNIPYTYFVVFKSTGTLGCPFSINNNSLAGIRLDGTSGDLEDRVTSYAGNTLRYPASKTYGNYALVSWVVNSSNSILLENGVVKATGNAGSQNTSRLWIGKLTGNDSFHLEGDIAEIIFYDDLLSTEKRQQVENYLISKYGL